MTRWTLPGDDTAPIITAEGHIRSAHRDASAAALPGTCVIFEMGMALRRIEESRPTEMLTENLPCFLDGHKCIAIAGCSGVCFTRGGFGAPAAVDALETVRALGVRRVVVAGMCGAFSERVCVGDVIVPHRILSEEGTSRHYFEELNCAEPDRELFDRAARWFGTDFVTHTDATVTTDAVYRQTFAKEAHWRAQGCVGVDMEASALLAVSRHDGLAAVAILLASDAHPLVPGQAQWAWGDARFEEARRRFVDEVASFALDLD